MDGDIEVKYPETVNLFSGLGIDYEPSIRGKVFVATIKVTDDVRKYMEINLDAEEEVKKAIVKGAFLGAGSVNDPNKQYHLEITFKTKKKAELEVKVENLEITLNSLTFSIYQSYQKQKNGKEEPK